MPLKYLIDEQLRGVLHHPIRLHNARGLDAIDAVRVGDHPEIPLGTTDPDLLLWAERNDRILVSADKGTMPRHLADHLRAGHHSPGVFLIRSVQLRDLIDFLALAAHASGPEEWRDIFTVIPQ